MAPGGWEGGPGAGKKRVTASAKEQGASNAPSLRCLPGPATMCPGGGRALGAPLRRQRLLRPLRLVAGSRRLGRMHHPLRRRLATLPAGHAASPIAGVAAGAAPFRGAWPGEHALGTTRAAALAPSAARHGLAAVVCHVRAAALAVPRGLAGRVSHA